MTRFNFLETSILLYQTTAAAWLRLLLLAKKAGGQRRSLCGWRRSLYVALAVGFCACFLSLLPPPASITARFQVAVSPAPALDQIHERWTDAMSGLPYLAKELAELDGEESRITTDFKNALLSVAATSWMHDLGLYSDPVFRHCFAALLDDFCDFTIRVRLAARERANRECQEGAALIRQMLERLRARSSEAQHRLQYHNRRGSSLQPIELAAIEQELLSLAHDITSLESLKFTMQKNTTHVPIAVKDANNDTIAFVPDRWCTPSCVQSVAAVAALDSSTKLQIANQDSIEDYLRDMRLARPSLSLAAKLMLKAHSRFLLSIYQRD